MALVIKFKPNDSQQGAATRQVGLFVRLDDRPFQLAGHVNLRNDELEVLLAGLAMDLKSEGEHDLILTTGGA